ncbi:MAG: hypothetical protein J6T73_05845, partial [Clostridia bacterium]|nr:hypothetical protein [Clostridia bacterium]
MKRNFKRALIYIGIPIILVLTYVLMTRISGDTEQTKYYQIVQMIKENKVSEFEMNLYSGELTYKLRADS